MWQPLVHWVINKGFMCVSALKHIQNITEIKTKRTQKNDMNVNSSSLSAGRRPRGSEESSGRVPGDLPGSLSDRLPPMWTRPLLHSMMQMMTHLRYRQLWWKLTPGCCFFFFLMISVFLFITELSCLRFNMFRHIFTVSHIYFAI